MKNYIVAVSVVVGIIMSSCSELQPEPPQPQKEQSLNLSDTILIRKDVDHGHDFDSLEVNSLSPMKIHDFTMK